MVPYQCFQLTPVGQAAKAECFLGRIGVPSPPSEALNRGVEILRIYPVSSVGASPIVVASRQGMTGRIRIDKATVKQGFL